MAKLDYTILEMQPGAKKVLKVLFAVYLVALHLVVIILLGERYLGRAITFQSLSGTAVPEQIPETDAPTPLPVPEVLSNMSPTPSATVPAAQPPIAATPGLMVPVLGVAADQLTDTFTQSRGTDRLHDAIDIMAPAGTPVIAADDGEIVRFWDSEAGGITIYQLNRDKTVVYYYAHLQRRADGIKEGDFVHKGATIGFVGDTGNAGAGNYHLHFSIARITDPKKYFTGEYINPYPILRGRPSQ